MDYEYAIEERDEAGYSRRARLSGNKLTSLSGLENAPRQKHVSAFLKKVFLPSGYPHSVSPDYLRYQVLNALQASCTSLAGLLSSRAILEGFGVGDPSASANHALLLTIVQDVFSRITTIFGAYALGSSLVPEAKTYRFLADILNDAAIILDVLSPLLNSPSLPLRIPGLRIGVLCLSASFRALCGTVAGGSKAAITLHFATPVSGNGDVGDLNAKDSSKETVLALVGMLLGSLIVPRLTTPGLTYTAMLSLVALHLVINYFGVRGLELRSINRQRAGIAWGMYRSSNDTRVPSPTEMAKLERILGQPDIFRDDHGRIIGRCTIGAPFSRVFRDPFPAHLLEIFGQERYLLWYDHQSLHRSSDCEGKITRGPLQLHILLKDGYSMTDQFKAWSHAAELCRLAALKTLNIKGPGSTGDDGNALSLLQIAFQQSSERFPDFTKSMDKAGWNINDVALIAGTPKAVLTSIEPIDGGNREYKKTR